ncbi:MAG: dTMP kinase [Azoarcus sp.]|jgi:dTMP kinase|nr:dTMP kinase [Azoarcus sp.]
MKNHPYPGIFVVFDGIDGSGKSTQVQRFAAAFAALGERLVVSKEPTDGPWGAKLRRSALSGRLPFEAELAAFIEDRREHLATKVMPALKEGALVVLDRYYYSTIAYQGLRTDDIAAFEPRIRAGLVEPDVAYFIEVPPAAAAARIQRRDGGANHFERPDDLVRLAQAFKRMAARDERIVPVNGERLEDEVFADILAHFAQGPFKRKRGAPLVLPQP